MHISQKKGWRTWGCFLPKSNTYLENYSNSKNNVLLNSGK